MSMKKLLKELLQMLEFESKDYRTESFPSIQDAIKQELARPEQEPVAWVVPTSHATQDGSMEDGPNYLEWAADVSDHEKKIGTPLYTAPLNREPLSDCDIHLIIKKAVKSVGITRDGSTSMRIARAVEKAHGIGVENETAT